MSPTSYQAAPPRVKAGIIDLTWRDSQGNCDYTPRITLLQALQKVRDILGPLHAEGD